jgi:hypothetical protein
MGELEAEALRTHLAANRRVAQSPQNETLGAMLFVYRQVLEKDSRSLAAGRAHRPQRLPTELANEELRQLMAA